MPQTGPESSCVTADSHKAPIFALGPSVIPGIVLLLDVAAIIGAFLLHNIFLEDISIFIEREFFVLTFYVFLTISMFQYVRLYKINHIMRPLAMSDQILIAMITIMLFLMSIIFSLGAAEDFNVISIITCTALCYFLIVLFRTAVAFSLRRLSQRRIIGSTVVIFGSWKQSQRLACRMTEAKPFFSQMIGFFSVDGGAGAGPELADGVPVLGGFDTLLRYVRERRVDDVIVALPWNADRAVVDAIDQLRELPVNVYLSSDLVGFELEFQPVTGLFQQVPLFEIVRRPISGWGFILKRVEDVVLSAVLLVAAAPLLAAIATLIRLDTPGPVLFRQRRLGFNNEVFSIYKFRSMHHDQAPETEVRQARRGDPRVTRVGRLLRASSLDELPQLFNVLEGSMSLVGPRPHALSHNEEYGRRIRGYFARHRVKPGITGWAQVNGLRGETDTDEKMARRVKYDTYYAENWSLLFDFKILLMTAITVLFQRNAY